MFFFYEATCNTICSSVCRLKQFAAVAALCVQYEADFRPNMSIVVKALQPLLNARAAHPGEHAGR